MIFLNLSLLGGLLLTLFAGSSIYAATNSGKNPVVIDADKAIEFVLSSCPIKTKQTIREFWEQQDQMLTSMDLGTKAPQSSWNSEANKDGTWQVSYERTTQGLFGEMLTIYHYWIVDPTRMRMKPLNKRAYLAIKSPQTTKAILEILEPYKGLGDDEKWFLFPWFKMTPQANGRFILSGLPVRP